MESRITSDQLNQAQNVYDLKSLNNLRQAALEGNDKALDQAAKQFESIFLGMMLKSMRDANAVLEDDDSPLNSRQVKYYQDMYDKQLASDLSSKGSVGLADLIVQQLGNPEGYTPASFVRDDGNLSSMNRNRLEATEQAQARVLGPRSQPAHKDSAFASPDEFVAALLPQAEKVADKLGLDPKALVAQAALETGWGQHMIHMGPGKNSHNLFGIKADNGWKGDKAVVNTLEFDNGVASTQKAPFRAYGSFAESFEDYAQFVEQNPRYAKAVRMSDNPEAYFHELQKAGYATDPDYANKVLKVLNSDILNGGNNQHSGGADSAHHPTQLLP
ncbi:Peptidoglycan hydrolase FlgJ [Saliniradius amylolyticus]|uniref:Peptidoglycan hydrolase FlgJ n=1 Tax=Saliniradius amylolyticus TaxID=2183582 RepID=A0A2S2E4X2_9ALTE|nr:flagellar assembly peptidoglycan hydrolase FlgJ [Saliniradius amylolyticus]AWL12572.1 Peptidoglycan hydrolase FlgJ [Saliniradius amylolyticus]